MPKTNQTMFEIDLLPKIRQYLNNQITWKQLYEFIRQNAELRHVSLDITNRCNLGCRHCFYTAESSSDELPFEDWRKIIRKLEKYGLTILTLSGKEPLLYKHVMKVLREFDRVKKQKREEKKPFRYGIVTNGTLLHIYLDELAKLDIDFLDVSLDGWGEAHDKLRGKGVFKRVLNNLMLAVDAGLADKIFIDSTLIEDNSQAILKLVKELSKRGISHFGAGMFFPTPYADFSFFVRKNTLLKLINGVKKLLRNMKKPIEFIISIEINVNSAYLPMLIENNIINLDEIEIDRLGIFYIKQKYGKSTLLFQLQPFIDPSYWQYVRIKSGEWLGSCDPLILPGTLWKQFSVGNAVDEPIEELYRRGVDKYFKTVMQDIDKMRKASPNLKIFKYSIGVDGLYYQVLRKGVDLGLFRKEVYDKILKITLEGRK